MKKLFIASFLSLLALAAIAEVITKTYEAEFDTLNSGMPAVFQVGQGVDISLSFDDSALTSDSSYELSDFSFVVEDAGFDFSSTANSKLNRDLLSGNYSLSVSGNGFVFDGKTLLSINMDFVNASSDSSDFIDYDLGGFYMTFYDPSSKTITAGSVLYFADASLPPMLSNSDFELKLEGDFDFIDFSELDYLAAYIMDSEFTSDADPTWTRFDDESLSFSGNFYLNDDGLVFIIDPIPEPAAYAVIFGALAVLICARRGRKN